MSLKVEKRVKLVTLLRQKLSKCSAKCFLNICSGWRCLESSLHHVWISCRSVCTNTEPWYWLAALTTCVCLKLFDSYFCYCKYSLGFDELSSHLTPCTVQY